MSDPLRFRWLGTAGIEIEFRGERLLIDPYLSRLPMRYCLFGRPTPRSDLVARHLLPSRAVLVSHAHYDHLLDVPAVCREWGAAAYGSSNVCSILRAHKIPDRQLWSVRAGDSFSDGPFDIDVLPGRHGRMMGLLPFAGPPARKLKPPLRLSDYRMDVMLSFSIRTEGGSALVWNGPAEGAIPPADALFYCPLWGVGECARIARAAGAAVVVPVHWDDFFRGLDRPIRPLIAPPGWRSPWIRRMDPVSFAASIGKIDGAVKVIVPRIFEYEQIGKP